MAANLKALSTKVKTYSKRLFKSGLGKHEVWLAYFACFVPAMTFTLAVSSFTTPQLFALQKSTIRATLAHLGFSRNISREIAFGSPLYGGIGLSNLLIEEGIAQLELLVRHLRARIPHGSLFLIRPSWWHLVLGFATRLWENDTANIPYIEYTWYSSLFAFLALINGSVHIPVADFLHWHPLCFHDTAIMEVISRSPGVSRADLKLSIIAASTSGWSSSRKSLWHSAQPQHMARLSSPLFTLSVALSTRSCPQIVAGLAPAVGERLSHCRSQARFPSYQNLSLSQPLGSWL
jgi:hypothetical protein